MMILFNEIDLDSNIKINKYWLKTMSDDVRAGYFQITTMYFQASIMVLNFKNLAGVAFSNQ